MTTHDRQKVQAQLSYVGDDDLVHAAVDRLLKQRKLVGDLRRVARADFKPKLSANLRKLKDRLVQAYRDSRFQPPEPASFANQSGGNAANLGEWLEAVRGETRRSAIRFAGEELQYSVKLEGYLDLDVVKLLERAAAAMAPESRLYILDTFWDRQETEAPTYSLQAISLYFTFLANGVSRMYKAVDIIRMLRAAGLEVERESAILGVCSTLLVCRKAGM